MNIDLNQLEAVIKLMEKYKLETVSIDGVSITKTVHPVKEVRTRKKKRAIQQPANWTEEDVLYYSSNAPKLDHKKLHRYATNVPNDMIPSGDDN